MSAKLNRFMEKVVHFFEQAAYHRLARELQFMSDSELEAAGISRDLLTYGKKGWKVNPPLAEVTPLHQKSEASNHAGDADHLQHAA